MELLRFRVLRGLNVWAGFPVAEAWLDVRPWPGRAVIAPAGLPLDFGDNPDLPHALERVALVLQRQAGLDAPFTRVRETGEAGIWRVVFECREETLLYECVETALALLEAAVLGQPYELAAAQERLAAVAKEHLPDAGTAALIAAARARNVPWQRLSKDGLLQLGHGARQRRIRGGETDRTGAIAGSIAWKDELCRQFLEAGGVPVPGDEPPAGTVYPLLVIGGRVVSTELEVHPETEDLAGIAARVCGLDVASVEVTARDIAAPLKAQGGAVTRVVAGPALAPFLGPDGSDPHAVGARILDLLFAPGENGRIPLAAVTGTNGKTTVTRLLAHILAGTGRVAGFTSTDGVYVAGRRITQGDCSGPLSARSLLQHPRLEAAVLETARGGILRGGLGFDECQVAVVTNIGAGDHLGRDDTHTLNGLARAKRIIVEAVNPRGTAVLNAADPLVAAMAPHCPGSVLFFARDAEHPVLAAHRAAGGRAVFAAAGGVMLAEGARAERLLDVAAIPMTLGGRIGFAVENALAALGAAWALGVAPEVMARQAATFAANFDTTPARFNVLEVHGATVIVDFGHNVDSLRAVTEALAAFPQTRRRAVFGASGDRRDEDIEQIGELLGRHFDRLILYEDSDTYGRAPGATMAVLRRGVARGGRTVEIEEMTGAIHALRHALDAAQPGELLLAQAHLADPTLAFLREYLGAA